jgi:Uma2 family endonuclease
MLLRLPPPLVGEKRLIFRNLDWQSFKQIQNLLSKGTRARFTYDNGLLEITMPLEAHERSARMIQLFVRHRAAAMGLKIKMMGSTTLDREDLLKSAEPDDAYYSQNFAKVADREINLDTDPPPDLVVEVDITDSDLNKNSLYASMGIPEFWRFNGRELRILQLNDGAYVECDHSPTFIIEKEYLYEFLEGVFHTAFGVNLMFLKPPPQLVGEKRLIFRDLDWQSFKQIQNLLSKGTRARFTYDNGLLEITMPLEAHERSARMIERFIWILVVEMGMKIKTMGSTTLDREDLLKSAEPDDAYYIQNFAKVADREINLDTDPPPDLVVEVDITNPDLNKNMLYAGMGIPEFWRFNGRELRILQLNDGAYVECDRSPTFPIVEKKDLYEFLETAFRDEVEAEVNFRQWVRQQIQT